MYTIYPPFHPSPYSPCSTSPFPSFSLLPPVLPLPLHPSPYFPCSPCPSPSLPEPPLFSLSFSIPLLTPPRSTSPFPSFSLLPPVLPLPLYISLSFPPPPVLPVPLHSSPYSPCSTSPSPSLRLSLSSLTLPSSSPNCTLWDPFPSHE